MKPSVASRTRPASAPIEMPAMAALERRVWELEIGSAGVLVMAMVVTTAVGGAGEVDGEDVESR